MQFLLKTIPRKNFGYIYSQGYLILSAIYSDHFVMWKCRDIAHRIMYLFKSQQIDQILALLEL